MTSNLTNLNQYLEVLLPKVSERLLTKSYRNRLLEIGKSLPLLRHGIIELREFPYDFQVDFMVCVFAREENTLLKNWLSNQTSTGQESWDRLYDFIKIWTTEGNVIHGLLSNVYLVFDNTTASSIIPVPWLYLTFYRLKLDADTLFELYRKSMYFIKSQLSHSIVKLLHKCFRAIEVPAWIFGFGFLNDRGSNELRIGISGFSDIEQILSFLSAIPWQGDLNDLKTKIGFMQGLAKSFVLALDLGEKINPRIGIECELELKGNRDYAEKMIEAIQERFAYDSDRAEDVLNWIGSDHHDIYRMRQIGSKRWLNHIKLTYEPKQPLKIKPYLYYNFEQ